MGYTHYFTPKKSSQEKFNEFVMACKKLHKALPKDIKICGGNGDGRPIFRNDLVCFNGDGSKDLDHERFYVEYLNDEWSFCKTASKPYDLLVCACLIAAKEILNFEVTSDGDFEDWKPAIKFYLDTLYSGKELDEMQMRKILPEFIFDDQEGNQWLKPYNVMKELFAVKDGIESKSN